MKKSELKQLIREVINEAGNFNYPRGSAILPLGSVNLQTGSCKYFNIYTTYKGGSVEVWETQNRKKVLVFTAGKSNETPGKYQQFYHDQSFRIFGIWKFIESTANSDMKSLILKYGKVLSGYTYK